MPKTIFNFYLGIVVSLFFLGCSAVTYGENIKKIPVVIPFYPGKLGEIYTFDVKITKQLEYSVGVRFYLIEPNKWSYLFDKDIRDVDPQVRRQFYDLMGGARFVNRQSIEPGLPAKFRVQIIQKKDGSMMLDETINHARTSASYLGRTADLVKKTLPPEIYTVRVEYLEGVPELASLIAQFLFVIAHHGK